MRCSLRQLQYFVAVVEGLNFSKAAAACYVSQPGLSAQIKNLERVLDVQLFERSRRKVLLTPAGAALLPRARKVLTAAADLEDAAESLTQPLCGKLRLGVIPTIAPYLLPNALPGIRQRYPQLKLLLHEDLTGRLLTLLTQGKLDLLLIALEADLGDVATLPLAADPFVAALPAGHPLSKREQIEEADLAGEQVLLLEDGHCMRDQALRVCDRAGAGEFGDFRAGSLNTLAQMVAGGIGITLLPQISLKVETRPPSPLAVRPFRQPGPSRTIGLAWRATSPRAEEFRLLGELLAPNQESTMDRSSLRRRPD